MWRRCLFSNQRVFDDATSDFAYAGSASFPNASPRTNPSSNVDATAAYTNATCPPCSYYRFSTGILGSEW